MRGKLASAVRGRRQRAGDACDQRPLGRLRWKPAAPHLPAGRVDQLEDDCEHPVQRQVAVERAVGLAALQQRAKLPEDRRVDVAQARRSQPGVDLDQRVVAPKRPPGGGQYPRQRLARIALGGVAGGKRLPRLRNRALGNGGDQRLTGGEVRIEGRARDPGPPRHGIHARLPLARELLDGGVEESRDAAARVGAAGPASCLRCRGNSQWMLTAAGASRSRGRNRRAAGRRTRARIAPAPAIPAAARNPSPSPPARASGPVGAPPPPIACAAIVVSAAIPSEPPTSWPVLLSPDSMPASSSRVPVITARATATTEIPSPTAPISRPGRTSPA